MVHPFARGEIWKDSSWDHSAQVKSLHYVSSGPLAPRNTKPHQPTFALLLPWASLHDLQRQRAASEES